MQQKKTAVQKDDESVTKICICLPYLGNKGEELVKTCLHKLKRYFKTNVKFVTLYDTKKCATFFLLKIRSLLIRNQCYLHNKMSWIWWRHVRKTDTCVITRLNGLSNHSDQPMFQHLQQCERLLETMTLYQLPDIDTEVINVNTILLVQFLIIERS